MTFTLLRSWFASPVIGLDVGTAFVRGAVSGLGTSFAEPSVVLLAEDGGAAKGRPARQVVAVGGAALRGLEEHRPGRRAVWPVGRGVVADRDAAVELFRRLFERRHTGYRRVPGLAVATVPAGATPVERQVLIEVLHEAGVRPVHLIDAPMAAAMGAGMAVGGPQSILVATIGAGITEIAVVAMGAIVACHSERVGGEDMDKAIVAHLRRSHALVIDRRTAERLKLAIGGARRPDDGEGRTLKVAGRDIVTGSPRSAVVSERDIADAVALPVFRIAEAVRAFMEETATDTAEHDFDTLVLTGGGALLAGLNQVIEDTVGLRTSLAEDPANAALRGLRASLTEPRRLRRTLKALEA